MPLEIHFCPSTNLITGLQYLVHVGDFYPFRCQVRVAEVFSLTKFYLILFYKTC